MTSEKNKLDKMIKECLNQEIQYEPAVPLNNFLSGIQPSITRKSAELKHTAKKRKEIMQIAAGYTVFIFTVPFFVLDFLVNGMCGFLIYIALILGLVSFLLVCCLPLLVKFKENIFERR